MVKILKASWLETPLGSMVAIGDEEALYLLEFQERKGLEHEIENLKRKTQSVIIPGMVESIARVKAELDLYFKGNLKEFKTALFFLGTAFQIQVWKELQKIPVGKTCSYSQLADAIGKPTACRAVAAANASNHLALIIPCHRVIHVGGNLGGYAGGVIRKQWLINHEKGQQ